MLCIVRKYDFFPSISDENNTKSRRQRLFSITKQKKKKEGGGGKKGKLSILARDQKDSRTKEIKRGSEVGERMNSGPYKQPVPHHLPNSILHNIISTPRREYRILVHASLPIQFYCELNIEIIYRYAIHLLSILCGMIDDASASATIDP